ncbi:roundabout homolog 2-like isoform X2 [Watersipora subatra]|uniref:roundabout homolog 2-like isoform X2 n=1 Tax=Watersipora subatra TaxID=2589382 RepID=UPI00355C3574
MAAWQVLVAVGLLVLVQALADGEKPVITTSPSDAYVARKKPYTLACRYESSSGATVTWYHNGSKVLTPVDDPNSRYTVTEEGDLFFLEVLEGDVGSYYCNVTNGYGSVISSNATLHYSSLSSEFRQQPAPTYTGVTGSMITLHCQPPRGMPEPKVRWEKDGVTLDIDRDQRLAIENPPGNLVIRNLEVADAAEYVCIGRNAAAEISSQPTVLSVHEKPTISLPPIDQFVNQGGIARFRCQASGDPEPIIEWEMDGANLDSSRTRVLLDNTLEIRDINPTDNGVYRCKASNPGGVVTAPAQLSVQTVPIFLEKPISKTVGRGVLVTFRCVASGSPQPTIYWSKARDDTMHLYPRQSKGRFSVLDDGSLRISDSQPADNGVYECFASNAGGRNSSSANLRVKETDSRPPPIITETPRNVTAALNQFAELQCTASGTPSPTIRWTHNKRPVLADARISINRGNLRITDVMVTDGGEYTCWAISESGDASAAAFLNVIGTRNNVIETLLPSTPERPMSSPDEVTDTSVKLYWGASAERDEVSFYSVEIFTLENRQGWETAVPTTTQPWAVVGNLQPGTSYIMLVRAHNSYGTSQPSPVTDYIKTTGTSPPPQRWSDEQIQDNMNRTTVVLKSLDVLSSTALNATWELPILYRKYVEGFYVRLSDLSGRLKKVDTVHGSLSNYHIITNIQPYTNYSVAITPFYLQFSGRPSVQASAKTLQDVPSGPPSAVEVHEGPRYISISWSAPKYSHQNGEITGYVIVCIASDSRLSRNFNVNSSVMNVALDNLNRQTNYTIGVAAMTVVGTGPVSQMWPINAKLTNPPDINDSTWWWQTVIGASGGLIWVALCIIIICLCKRRRLQKTGKKQTNGDIVTVPLETASASHGLSLQYTVAQGQQMQRLAMGRQLSAPHMSPNMMSMNGYPGSYSDANIDYDQQNMDNYDDSHSKAFYDKGDEMAPGPYATTVILNNRPEREEARFTPEAHRGQDGESSTDNNCTGKGEISNSSGDRSSPPVLPSFADMLPPPPLYPPPLGGTPSDKNATSPRPTAQPALGTIPRVAPQCHTCHRSYHSSMGGEPTRPHYMLDTQTRLYNPTVPHVHSFSNHPYNGSIDYNTAYPSIPRSDCRQAYQPYNVCIPHSSDSHDYAEPQFDQQNLYDGVPLHPSFPRQNIKPVSPHQPLQQQLVTDSGRILPGHQSATSGQEVGLPRHHSIPSSEHELCMSCAEQTEYEEPWSDQHWPHVFGASHAQHMAMQCYQHQAEQDGEEEQTEKSPMLAGEPVASSAGEGSHGSNTAQSKSGSRQRQRRRQRAQSARPSSPYNGYSTDSSVVFVPRKPYPKSERRKQMNAKPKNTKSLAVQVEQEEMTHEKV